MSGWIYFPPFCFIWERRCMPCGTVITWPVLSPSPSPPFPSSSPPPPPPQLSDNRVTKLWLPFHIKKELNDLELPPSPTIEMEEEKLSYIYASTTWLGQRSVEWVSCIAVKSKYRSLCISSHIILVWFFEVFDPVFYMKRPCCLIFLLLRYKHNFLM